MNYKSPSIEIIISNYISKFPDGPDRGALIDATDNSSLNGHPSKNSKSDKIKSIERGCEVLIKHSNQLEVTKDRKDGAAVRFYGAVPASTLNFLTWRILVMCNQHDLIPPVALLDLVRNQLGVRSEDHKKKDQQFKKRDEAALYAHRNPNSSFRDVAKQVDVNVSTITRWNEAFDIRKRGEMILESKLKIYTAIIPAVDEMIKKDHGQDDTAEMKEEYVRKWHSIIAELLEIEDQT